MWGILNFDIKKADNACVIDLIFLKTLRIHYGQIPNDK